MRVKKLLLLVITSILSMLLFSLFFMFITKVDDPKNLGNFIGEIYKRADADTKNSAIASLNSSCSLLITNENIIVELKNLCEDPERIGQIQTNCQTYLEGRKQNIIPANPELERLCNLAMSFDIELKCKELKKNNIDTSAVTTTCDRFQNRVLSDGEFFSDFVLAGIGANYLVLSKLQGMSMLIISGLIVVFLIILVLLYGSIYGSLYGIGRALFNVGVIFLLMGCFIWIYMHNVHIDTTSILQSILKSDFASARSSAPMLVPLLLSQFTLFYILLGVVMIIAGISLKIFFREYKV